MKAVKEEFPNPVLAPGRDDYIEECSFRTDIISDGITVDNENIIVPVKYELVCEGIRNSISKGDAVVIMKVGCSETAYRELFRFSCDNQELMIRIPKYAVATKIELEGSVIASRRIQRFKCQNEFNPLYFSEEVFDIRKGDLLAVGESVTVYIDDSELEKPLSSVFIISKNDEQTEEVIPDFYGDRIEIRLKSELYDLYYLFKDFNNGALRRYATGIIVYPVLVEAVGYIVGYYQNESDGGIEDFSNKRWFRAIEHKAASKAYDMRNYEGTASTLANELLGDIALDALKRFKDTLDSEINSGETEMIGGVD